MPATTAKRKPATKRKQVKPTNAAVHHAAKKAYPRMAVKRIWEADPSRAKGNNADYQWLVIFNDEDKTSKWAYYRDGIITVD